MMEIFTNSTSQAALEHLATYGWALLVVLIAVGALSYFGIFDIKELIIPSQCTLIPGLTCSDFVVGENAVQVVLTNSLGQDITVKDIDIRGCQGAPSSSSFVIKDNQKSTFTIGLCNINEKKYSSDLNVTYAGESRLDHTVKGEMTGRNQFEELNYDYQGTGLSLTSCKEILDTGYSNGDGTYKVDPDGDGGSAPFDVYCDMTNDGGGWTLVYKLVATGSYSHPEIVIGSSSKNYITQPLSTEKDDGINLNVKNYYWTKDGVDWMSKFIRYDNAGAVTNTKWYVSELADNVDWGNDMHWDGKSTGCKSMPGKVALRSSTGANYGGTSYRYVAVTDGRGFLASQDAGGYHNTCGQSSNNLLTSQPGDIDHFWYADSSYRNKNKDRCTWVCWAAPDDYNHVEGYSGREFYARG